MVPRRRTRAGSTVLQGKDLSFTNLLDLDSAARIAWEFDEPAAVVIKHTNPCGAATGAVARGGLRPRARRRRALGLRRHRRPEPADRRRRRRGRSRRRSSRRSLRPAIDDEALAVLAVEAEPARRRRGPRAGARAAAPLTRMCGRCSTACWCRSATRSTRRRAPWPPADLGTSETGARVVTKRPPTADEWRGAALRLARLRAREVEHGDLHRTPSRRSPSAPVR